MSPTRFAVGTQLTLFALPLPPVSQGNRLQRNRRQTVSERQLPCAWLLLQIPLCFRTAARPGLPAPPTRRSLCPHEPPHRLPVLSPSLSPSVLKIISRKHILPLLWGGSRRQMWKSPPSSPRPAPARGPRPQEWGVGVEAEERCPPGPFPRLRTLNWVSVWFCCIFFH